MARSRATPHKYRPRRKKRSTLRAKGWTASLLGAALLLSPWFMGGSPLLLNLAKGLRPVGWVALALGVALLCLQRVLHGKPGGSGEQRGGGIFSSGGDDASAAQFRPMEPANAWSAEVFAAIEWRRFEAVCEALFAQSGFETHSQSHGADGGVDIWLRRSGDENWVSIVQCKHWHGRSVGVKEMREFFGVMASHQLEHGVYATTSSYTPDARQFADANGIEALDGGELLDLIATRSRAQQEALLDVAFEGDYWRPTCASCGTKMVERAPANGGAHFWGCSQYPRCKFWLSMGASG